MLKKRGGHQRFYKILDELAELHSRKNSDYASNENPLGNFKRVAHLVDYYNLLNSPCPTEVKVALIYSMKQLDCFLYALQTGKELKVEGLQERLRDIDAYLILIEILLNEK